MSKDVAQVTVKCPTCGKKGAWFATLFGPFCSHRCKMIDLGKWLGEEHTISEPLRPEHVESYNDHLLRQNPDNPGSGQPSGAIT